MLDFFFGFRVCVLEASPPALAVVLFSWDFVDSTAQSNLCVFFLGLLRKMHAFKQALKFFLPTTKK